MKGEFIKVAGENLFLLNKGLLGASEAQLWIGERAEGPTDDNDERVLRERKENEAKRGTPEYKISGIEAVNLRESEKFSGWYEVNTADWKAGVYRLMIHGKANEKTSYGSPISPSRDLQYSWPIFPDEYLKNLSLELKKFLYLEKNKRGFCIRVEIVDSREIKPAGDGVEWIYRWDEIKKARNKHIQRKIKAVKTENRKSN